MLISGQQESALRRLCIVGKRTELRYTGAEIGNAQQIYVGVLGQQIDTEKKQAKRKRQRKQKS